jgi:hypothetical protein
MRAKISLNNYDEFALDYLEGTLDAETHAEMQDFLEKHPTLKHEIEQLSSFVLVPDTQIVYLDKAKLYRKPVARKRWLIALIPLLFGTSVAGIWWLGQVKTADKYVTTKDVSTEIVENTSHAVVPQKDSTKLKQSAISTVSPETNLNQKLQSAPVIEQKITPAPVVSPTLQLKQFIEATTLPELDTMKFALEENIRQGQILEATPLNAKDAKIERTSQLGKIQTKAQFVDAEDMTLYASNDENDGLIYLNLSLANWKEAVLPETVASETGSLAAPLKRPKLNLPKLKLTFNEEE